MGCESAFTTGRSFCSGSTLRALLPGLHFALEVSHFPQSNDRPSPPLVPLPSLLLVSRHSLGSLDSLVAMAALVYTGQSTASLTRVIRTGCMRTRPLPLNNPPRDPVNKSLPPFQLNSADTEYFPTEPQYLYEPPTTAVLSETRPTNLSPPALTALNFALDELLQLWVHASLSPSTATTPPISSTVAPPLAPGPLGPKQVFTTERLKQGVIRVVGPYLGKNVVLEAELAVRELLRLAPPSLRADAALKKGNFGSPTTVFEGQDEGTAAQQADEIFRSLRAWVQLVSGLGGALGKSWCFDVRLRYTSSPYPSFVPS